MGLTKWVGWVCSVQKEIVCLKDKNRIWRFRGMHAPGG